MKRESVRVERIETDTGIMLLSMPPQPQNRIRYRPQVKVAKWAWVERLKEYYPDSFGWLPHRWSTFYNGDKVIEFTTAKKANRWLALRVKEKYRYHRGVVKVS